MRTSSATHASKPAHPQPKQIRSRKTEDALLSAAIRVLDRESFGQVTIPLIAAEAKLSPASTYRRFLDKDDLLRAAVARMLGDPATAARRSEQPLAHQSLAGTVDAMIARLLTNIASTHICSGRSRACWRPSPSLPSLPKHSGM